MRTANSTSPSLSSASDTSTTGYYTTPEIVTQTAFDAAWRTFCGDDPEPFLRRIPTTLLDAFLQRVGQSAHEEVRRLVGDSFRRWAQSLTAGDLASVEAVRPLVILAEVDPLYYVPLIRDLVERATREELLAVEGGFSSQRPPRRYLVSLAERMMVLPDLAYDAEAILLRLAVAENEQRIGNNATSTWRQFYHIRLSGTPLPFPQRLGKLRERIYSGDPDTSSLGMKALDAVFDTHAHRVLGPPVVASRIPPKEWDPATAEEWKVCVDSALDVLAELASGPNASLQASAYEITIENTRTLLGWGYLGRLRELLNPDRLPPELRARAAVAAEACLHFDVEHEEGQLRRLEAYAAEVRGWLERLRPPDIHGRLLTAVGVDPWHHSIRGDKEAWEGEIRSLADNLYSYPATLEAELEWLFSPGARSAHVMGEVLGKHDGEATLLQPMLEATLRYRSTGFTRGYIRGLMEAHPAQAAKVNATLDRLEASHPQLAYELATAASAAMDALGRTLALVDRGVLPASYLRAFVFEIGLDTFHLDRYERMLLRLVEATERGDRRAQETAIELLAYPLAHGEESNRTSILSSSELRELAWRLLQAVQDAGTTESYEWGQILDALVPLDPDRTARVAVDAIVGRDHGREDEGKRIFKRLAAEHPEIAMTRLGEAALDPERSWFFHVDNYKDLVEAMPLQTVEAWLRRTGVEGARLLARHLRPPYVDEDDQPLVPPLTQWVLESFEEDDSTFEAFAIGTHAFEVYMGDMAAHHEREMQVAERFMSHPLRRVREWARYEIDHARQQAEWSRQREEELWTE